MAISKTSLLLIAAVALAGPARAVSLRAQAGSATDAHAAFGGIWVISPDAQLRGPDTASAPSGAADGGRRAGGGGRSGGRGSGGGYGGGGGNGGGGHAGTGAGGGHGGRGVDGNVEERQAIAAYARTLLQPAKQMTIVPHDMSLAIAYDDGRTLTLEATNRKVGSRAENGFVKLTRKSRWMDGAMISEVEIEGGPTFDEKYEVIAEGTELRVSIATEGGGSGGRDARRTITHVYERPMP